MRAFAGGYYENLIRMYEYLGIQFRSQPFLYTFERDSGSEEPADSRDGPYFIHSSNNHRLPPLRPRGVNLLTYLLRVIYVAACYAWWSIYCFSSPPLPASRMSDCESLRDYVQRIWLPVHFVNFYMLPLLSSVATCSHDELLASPAQDAVDYKSRSAGQKHYTVAGVHAVQRRLGKSLVARLSATVTDVEVLEADRVQITWVDSTVSSEHKEVFDRVVLAVAPDVVGKIFKPLTRAMDQIPSTSVTSFVSGGNIKMSSDSTVLTEDCVKGSALAREAQTIHFRTSTRLGQTESLHIHPSGAIVTSCPLRGGQAHDSTVLKTAQFRRGLRTPASRRVVNSLFEKGSEHSIVDEKMSTWRNGDDNIWLAGGWCWDGMVLLEGCVVSAMRVARDLDIDVPWSR